MSHTHLCVAHMASQRSLFSLYRRVLRELTHSDPKVSYANNNYVCKLNSNMRLLSLNKAVSWSLCTEVVSIFLAYFDIIFYSLDLVHCGHI